jgi:elongation of very long chain fatty acids protein 7
VFCHTIQIQFQPECNFPKSIGVLLTLNAALFTYMFSSFYIKSYNKKAKAAMDEKKMVYDENSNVLSNGDKVIKAE